MNGPLVLLLDRIYLTSDALNFVGNTVVTQYYEIKCIKRYLKKAYVYLVMCM